jgi:hypothetical protein
MVEKQRRPGRTLSLFERRPREAKGSLRETLQFTFLDNGVPKSTKVMKDLVRELDIAKGDHKKPILVHCR